MEKYGVLFLIIMYAIALGITGVLFYPDTIPVKTTVFGVGTQTYSTQTTWEQLGTGYKFLAGALVMSFPGVPLEINAILFIPYILLIILFIYYHIPTVSVLGTNVSTKEP
jgi:hypothetical protein